MPTLGAPLDFAKLEGRNFVGHLLGTAPSSPVKGQLYMNTADNTLYWYDGTVWVAAKSGSGTPTGSAGGDLSGTYPNPQIAAGVIVDADVAAANKDGVIGTPSLRTLGAGAQQAMPGNRTLDAITGPANNVQMNAWQIRNLGDPSTAQDAATKNYVDNTAQGLDAKASVIVATTGNITLSGTQTIDGVAVLTSYRVLVKDQTTPAQNGIYIVAGGAWTRATDIDSWNEHVSAYTWVEQGTTNADTGWVCTADAGGTLGTTAIPWTQFTGAAQIGAGAGLVKTGNTIDAVAAGGGAGPILVNPDSIDIKLGSIAGGHLGSGAVDLGSATVTGMTPVVNGGTNGNTPTSARTNLGAAGYYSSATHASGTSWTIPQSTHGCRASRGLIVQVRDEASGAWELPDIVVAANGDVTITYANSQPINTKRTTIIG